MRFPELRGDERTTMEQFLDHYRENVIGIVSDLSFEEASDYVLPATNLTIGGIVKHLAVVEDLWFRRKLLGEEPHDSLSGALTTDGPDASFRLADDDTVERIVGLYIAACERSREAAARFASLDDTSAAGSFGKGPVSLRWVLVHMLEETARHAGHMDLIQDAIVGQRGAVN